MCIEIIYKYIFKWLKFGYPKEYCLNNIVEILQNENKDFLQKYPYLNETLFEFSDDYPPLRSLLLPTILDDKEFIIDPIIDMDIHYFLKSKYPNLPMDCFFLSNDKYIKDGQKFNLI